MSSNRFEGLPIKVIGGLAALGVAVIAYKMSTTPRNRPASPLIERLVSILDLHFLLGKFSTKGRKERGRETQGANVTGEID